jgi:hypothetical protein
LIIFCVIVGIVFGDVLKKFLEKIELLPINFTACRSDADCDWVSINCCPEHAGAFWECKNLGIWEGCPKDEFIICLQVLSPKPKNACICIDGECVVK